MDIKVIGVIGAGTMGHGIAQVALQAGFQVLLGDVAKDILEKARSRIAFGLAKGVEKGKFSETQKEEMFKNLTLATTLADFAAADFVIEAVAEDFSIKKDVLGELDRVCRPEVILATNTSSISITKIAATTSRPSRVIGMHFFNPVLLMRLLEIIRGLATEEKTVAVTRQLAERLGKIPVEANDSPGFLANRILIPMINEAIYALMEGVGTAEAIDTVMKLGANHPMGPLALADLVGLDVCLAVLRTLHEGFGDSKYRPCPLLVRMVEAGFLGQKTGRGFYSYEHTRKE
ncbi:MAG: 3-hydroxybutyryl-CoA dehydrogenase [candidate division NC10 bacterium]|nr:3-hydroxybutyryl-CoA dehydrogenase [candidate division NC10 bacterium]